MARNSTSADGNSLSWQRIFSLDVRKEHLPAWSSPRFRSFVVDEKNDHLHTLIDHVLFTFQLSEFPERFCDRIDAVYIKSVSFDSANGLLAIGGTNQSGNPPLKLYDTKSRSFVWVTTDFSDDFMSRVHGGEDGLHERYGPRIIKCPFFEVDLVGVCSEKRLLALTSKCFNRGKSPFGDMEHSLRIMTYNGEAVAETTEVSGSALAFHPEGSIVAITSGVDVILVHSANCSIAGRRTVASADLVGIVFDTTGQLIFTASQEGEIYALDAALIEIWSARVNAIPRSLRFDSSNQLLWIGTNLGDLFAFRKCGVIESHIRVSESVTDVAAIHDGKHLLVGCKNMDIHVFANSSMKSRINQPKGWEERLRKQKTSCYTSTASITTGRVFISYSSRDKQFASYLEKRLESDGFTCWRDEHSLTSGRITKQIQRAIMKNDVVLVILSRTSLSSDWVRWEIDSARKAEKATGQDMICPIAIDTAWQSWDDDPVLKREILKYHIVDFAEWTSPEVFDRSHRRLLAGLKENYMAESEKAD